MGRVPRRKPSRRTVASALTTLLALIAVVGLAASPAAAAGTLDQSQTDTGGFQAGAEAVQSPGQTFTAGITGTLDQVDVFIFNFGPATAPLTVEIRNATGDLPGTTVLASTSLASSSVPTSLSWVSATFNPGTVVTAGTQYAIVLRSSTPPPSTAYGWRGSSSNVYPGGRAAVGDGNAANWSPTGADSDWAFKTYVIPSQLTVTSVSPSSGATGTAVHITGTNLHDPSPNCTATPVVHFGTATATPTNVQSASLDVIAPSHAAGTVDVTVTNNCGITSPVNAPDGQFTFTAPPAPAPTCKIVRLAFRLGLGQPIVICI